MEFVFFLLAVLKNPDPTKSDIELCHTSCDLLDAGTAADTLKTITTFLQNNPNDIITIFWRNFFSNLTATDFKTAFDKAGLTQYCYTQPLNSSWPTMSRIISSGKRVINFLDSGADTTTVPCSWQCTIDRPKDQPRPIYLLNHFLYTVIPSSSLEIELPTRITANLTNSVSLQAHAQNCTNIFKKSPNFIAVDFYDQGSPNLNPFSIVANYNGVQYTPKTY
ncbi:5957_t:CDS:2, partial [Cetraspora pellucida]